MKKFYLTLLCLGVAVFSGCTNNSNKIYLDDEFYGTGEFLEITADDFSGLNNTNYVLFTFNNFCALAIPCDQIFQQFMEENNISFLSMKFDEFKNISLHETVRFAPSVIIVNDGKIVAYLDSEKEEDVDKYQDVEEFKKWISKYIYLSK